MAIFALSPLAPIHAAPLAQNPAAAPLERADLEAFLDSFVPQQLAQTQIPGAAVVIVHNGVTLLAKGYGLADVEQGIPVDAAQTIFRTGSVGKLFTWTAVMQLVEQGRLDLDADINDYLDFAIPAAFGEPITLAHLMTHTPGFENLGEDLFVLSAQERMPLRDYLVLRMPQRVYAPGTVGAYSNYGAALAGYMVERISGEPFDAYVENHIFAPLGMARSTLRQPVPAPLANDLATGYGVVEGAFVGGEFIFVSPYPAGAAATAPADMAHFMLTFLQEGRVDNAQLLQPATVHAMLSPAYRADPRLAGMTLGWMERRINDRLVIHHKGSIVAFHTGLYLVPEAGLGVYVAYNGVNAAFAPDPLLEAILDRYFPAATDATGPVDAGLVDPPLSAYTGEYHQAVADYSSMGKVLRVLETAQVTATPDNHLAVTLMGQTELFRQTEPGVFRSLARDELLLFPTDAEGTTWLVRDALPHFSFFRPPWYAQAGVTALALVGGLLLFLVSGLAWLARRIIRRVRGKQGRATPVARAAASPAMRVARVAALLFGLLLVAYLITFLSLLGQMHPAYGVPLLMFGTPAGAELLVWLPWLLAATGLTLTLAVGAVWIQTLRRNNTNTQSAWGIPTRLHYTLMSLSALAILAVLRYWNLWAVG